MKYILITLFTLISTISEAKCGNRGVRVFPYDKNIDINGTVIIEAFGFDQMFLKYLDDTQPIYLMTDNEKIRLIKQVEIIGHFKWSQAVFKAEFELTKGKTYKLVIDDLHGEKRLKINPYTTIWTATDQSQSAEFNFSKKITPLHSNKQMYGCGTGANSVFSIETKLNERFIVLAEIKNETTGEIFHYYLISNDKKLEIGHGMCNGPFIFNREQNYSVRFKNFESAHTADWTSWMVCENPWH